MNNSLFQNLSGQRFGRLLIVSRAPNNNAGDAFWFCQCDCGSTIRRVMARSLRTGATQSCGCRQRERAKQLKCLPFGEGAFNQLFRGYQHTARKRNIDFHLTKEQFKRLTKGSCFYCGAAPSQTLSRKFYGKVCESGEYTYNGVDRLDSTKGYTADNCVSCCGTHNLMKLDMSVDDFIAACRAVIDHQDFVATTRAAA